MTLSSGPDTHQQKMSAETAKGYDGLSLYYGSVNKSERITKEEEQKLAVRAQAGEQSAIDALVQANLKLVVHIAQTYQGLPGTCIEDLISDGNIGLIRAAQKFRPGSAKFSTYAAFWIKQSIMRGYQQTGRTIRVPVHQHTKFARLLKIEHKLWGELGREPTHEELAETMGVSMKTIKSLTDWMPKMMDLDAPFVDDGTSEKTVLKDVLADENTVPPDQAAAQADAIKDMFRAMGDLTERERDILSKRFGLDGNKGMTLDKIGREHGVTRERIRQIQQDLLVRMKIALRKNGATPKKSFKIPDMPCQCGKPYRHTGRCLGWRKNK